MDAGVIIEIGIGVLGGLGFLALLWGVYKSGINDQKVKQDEEVIESLKKQSAIDAEPKPTSSDDRNSMRNGDF